MFSERFVAEEVDAYLGECAAAFEAYEAGDGVASLRSDDIVVKQFEHTRFGGGYDPDEVDDYLDQVVVALRVHEAGRVDRAREAGPASPPRLTADDVRSKTFTVRGIGAVEREPVDTFLARCADALDAARHGEPPELTAAEVLATRFPRALVQLGYVSDEVDEFLGEVAETLAALAGGR